MKTQRRAPFSRAFSLQQAGFTSPIASPQRTVGFYPTRFTSSGSDVSRAGCVVSVALSLKLLLVAVSNCLYPLLPGLSSRPLLGTGG